MNKLRVAITGTHSTGKTTLAKALEKHTGISYVRGDSIQQIMKARFPGKKLEDLSTSEYWDLERIGLAARLDAESRHKEFISDGCTINSVAYALMECGSSITTARGYPDFERSALINAQTYTHILYLPPEIPLENDGFRPKSGEFREHVDDALRKILAFFPIRALLGTRERRVDQSLRVLGLEDTGGIWDNYVAFEGVPRSGKTTQIRLLEEYAKKKGINVHISQRLKNNLAQEIKSLRNPDPYGNAARIAELFAELQFREFEYNRTMQRLEAGQIVVSDRQKFSTIAMCGALGIPLARLYALTNILPTPGKVIYMRTLPKTAVERAVKSAKKYALAKDLDYVSKTADLFDTLGRWHGFLSVDAERDPLDIHLEVIRGVFGDKNG